MQRFCRTFLINLIILSIVLIISVIGLEFSLSYFYPQYNPSGRLVFHIKEEGVPLGPINFDGMHWNSSMEYRVHVHINKYGFRDKKDISESTLDDIFVVGDSFAFGWGVEEDKRFSNLLESRLNRRVYNISIPADLNGYEKLIKYAQQNGAKIKNLIIAVCMENDLGDYENKQLQAYIIPSGKKSLINLIKNFLEIRSTSYNMIANIVHCNTKLMNIAISIGLINDSYNMINIGINNDIIISSSIQKLSALSKPFNTTIIVIPSKGLWVGCNTDNENQIHNKFINSLRETGLVFIDMRPYFEEGGNPLQYHYLKDGHWNELGHFLAARAIGLSFCR